MMYWGGQIRKVKFDQTIQVRTSQCYTSRYRNGEERTFDTDEIGVENVCYFLLLEGLSFHYL